MKNSIKNAIRLPSWLSRWINNIKKKWAILLFFVLWWATISSADAQCCWVNYSMVTVWGWTGSMYTNVFSPNNWRTKDVKGLQVWRQGQAWLLRLQWWVEVWKGWQEAEDGSRSYTWRFPKVFAGGGIWLPDESVFLPYIFVNGWVGASLITWWNNNGEPIQTPQVWWFVEWWWWVEIQVINEILKIFAETKYTQVLWDNLEWIKLDDWRNDAQFTWTIWVRFILQ